MAGPMRKKTGGRDFKPGNKAGVGHGRPKISEEERTIRDASRQKLSAVMNKFINGWSFEQLMAFVQDKTNDVFEVMVARMIMKGIASGDPKQMNFFMDRLVGPVAKEVNLHDNRSFHARLVDALEDLRKENDN